MQAALGSNVLQSATTVSEAGNPYISSERLPRDNPLKFGLKKNHYNTHLSSQMEPRSPKLDNIASGDENMPANPIITEADELSPRVDFKPRKSGNFFGSTKTLRKSQGLAEARMEFTVNGLSVPPQVSYYQNITKELANKPFASYIQGQFKQQQPVVADSRNMQI